MNWETFLDPYIQAVSELKVKLRSIRKQFHKQKHHSPIEFVTGRVKPIESIQEKMVLRGISMENLAQDMQDIAGIRIMVQFAEDVAEVRSLIHKRKDMRIIQERDYIGHKKPSGYRSYHIIVAYQVETVHGSQTILAEIQIRTLAMNFWATIEHSLNYKYKGEFPNDIKERLELTARIAEQLDEEMSKIREDIQEAQALYELNVGQAIESMGNRDDADEEYS